MPRESRSLIGFNRGIISSLALARVDLPRTQLSAQFMNNWQPRSLGAMMLRPGWGYIGNSLDDELAKYIPFVFSNDDIAHLEVTEAALRVRVDDELITRPAVTAAISNGTFTTNLTGWTDNDEGSAASAFVVGGYMGLLGTGTDAAIRDQAVVVVESGTQHALRVVVTRGPVILRVGSTIGDDDYIAETTLGTGTHSLAFTPVGTPFYIRLMNRRHFTALVDSIAVEAAGVMEVPTPWDEDDLKFLRIQPSGDILYVACKGYQQRKVERRSTHSWSVVLYEPETGPFRVVNISPITLSPSALNGDVQLTASKPFFTAENVGSLFRIQSVGQNVTAAVSAQNTFTNPIRVSGVGGGRIFGIIISGTFSATVTLQYSVSEPGNWVDISPTYAGATSESHDDGLDNQVIYYRIGVKTGDFTSGTADLTLTYSSGSIVGIARVTGFVSSTVVNAVVLTDFGALTASADWWEGQWSDRRGWPSAVRLHESRMGFGGRDRINMSISDAYEDFDDEFEGDAGPINRTIGEGPVETIPWMLSLNRLIVGTLSSGANIDALKIQGNNPLSGRSSSFEEPLTPTNFNLKTCAATGIYVDPSLTRLYELKFDLNESDYLPEDLCIHVPDLNEVKNLAGICVQYKPDLRIWCWRTDGTVAVLLRDRAEGITCWYEFETDGFVEDVSVLPGTVEDRVYLSVRRTVDGTVRFLEKVALESECRGGTVNKQADAFVTGTNSPASATISGLPYADGTEVIAWADGVDQSADDEDGVQRTYTVSGGAIVLDAAVTSWMAGLPYEARWKSMKLAFAAALGSALNIKGKIGEIGLVLKNAHARGLKYGPSFDSDDLSDLPLEEDDGPVDEDSIHEEYDKAKLEFDGEWETDPRVCLVARAPRCVTVLACTVDLVKSG